MKKISTSTLQRPMVICLLAAFCCLLWGSAFPAVKIGYGLLSISSADSAEQLIFAGLRFFFAGVATVLFHSASLRRLRLPARSSLWKATKLGLIQTLVQYALFYIGMAHTSGVKGSVLMAVHVFFAILISAKLFHYERLNAPKLLGCLCGFGGVLLINLSGGGLGGGFTLLGDGAVLLAALANGFSISLFKRYAGGEDTLTLCEMAQEEDDASQLPEVTSGYEALEKEINERRLAALLSGEYDANNAILTFHAGAGGTEAQDWTEMLYRMYTRWAERHGYTYQLMDYEAGDEAGIKSATILIEGENAYGYLKSENGVHRLVRVSPFDANARRQTSFAALEVMPELDDDSEIEIRPEDIEMQACRSSGAGGQHINKTSSAVRLTHLPTGIVVFCQTERSQFQNRDNAMKMLRAKLAELKLQQHAEKISDLKGVQMKIEWGSQIRSYVFMPYTLAKDTRTGYEMGNIQAVMDGDIDGFINAYLTAAANGEIKK